MSQREQGLLVTYAIGIDLGTTYSAAAVAENGHTEILSLGYRSATVPSVIVLREDGEVLIGEGAERRALMEPLRTAREFKRRLGDPTPILLGGTPYSAEALMSYLLRGVYDLAVEQMGRAPASLVVTHPANYGPYKLDLLAQAVRMAEVGEATFVSEPIAAALHYAGRERIEPGEVVAVYDFGGGTFDAALLRRTESGFESLGEPEGLERLGGIDFDEAVFAHTMQAIADMPGDLDPDDTATMTSVVRLREECREAKEALSVDTDVVIPVVLPSIQTEVRLTRGEFESMISPRIGETIAALRRAVRSAGLEMDDVDKVLLVGGSSRIPLVRQRVREETNAQIFVDAHPKHAIALGAAVAAQMRLTEPAAAATMVEPLRPTQPAGPPPQPEPEPVSEAQPEAATTSMDVEEAPDSAPLEPADQRPQPGEPEAPEVTPAQIEMEPETEVETEIVPEPPREPLTRQQPVETLEPSTDEFEMLEPAGEFAREPIVDVPTERTSVPVDTWSDRPGPGDEVPTGGPPVAAAAAPDLASSKWLDGIDLSPSLIGALAGTAILSAIIVFILLSALVG